MFLLSLLVFLPLVAIAAGPGAHKNKLVGHWTFEKGEELKDLTGNFPDIELRGAKVVNGALDVDAGKWAITVGDYKSPEVTDMTLISWATIQDQAVIKESLLCLDHVSKDEIKGLKEGTLGSTTNVDASSKLPMAWAKIKTANN